jgi:hypothetical protein
VAAAFRSLARLARLALRLLDGAIFTVSGLHLLKEHVSEGHNIGR